MKNTTLAMMLFAVGAAALAHGGVTNKDVIARMDTMQATDDEMNILGTMTKGQAAFDAGAANAALTAVAAQSAQIAAMFEMRADDPKSKALAVIREDWEMFARLATDPEALSRSLAGTITDEKAPCPAPGELGGTCEACHSKFRK